MNLKCKYCGGGEDATGLGWPSPTCCPDCADKEPKVTTDTMRLDGLEAVPFAIEIKYNLDQPKADSVPSLRSQIDAFLAQYKIEQAKRAAEPANAPAEQPARENPKR